MTFEVTSYTMYLFNIITINLVFLAYRLDLSNEIMSLHIGDKILEVNGTPIKDQPIENIENLMRNSNSVLQVSF